MRNFGHIAGLGWCSRPCPGMRPLGVPMSRYTYGYSLAPARPTGWRSAFGNFIGVTAVVSLSVISGAVVAYNLIGGDARFVSTPVSSTPVSSAAVAPVQAQVE